MKNKKTIAIVVIIILLLILIGIIFFLMNRKYTVTFETSAGVTKETQTVKKDDLVKEPEEPTREGYTFAGWYYADNQDKKYDFSSKVDKNITLIAKWFKAEENEIKGVSISANKTTLEVDEELTLSIKTQPEGISLDGRNVSWISSDTSVVTVDENGKVKAIKAGTATITVEVDGIKATVGIKVNKEERETEPETESKKTNTENKSNTSKNNNTSKDTKTETKPEETKPETNPEPKPTPVTYKAVWGDKLPNDIAGQYYLYIESSEGKRVAGTATVKYKGGKTKTETIPANGIAIVKSAVESISNVKAK